MPRARRFLSFRAQRFVEVVIRVKVLGSGPIYDGTRAVCEAAGWTLTSEGPLDLVILANVLRILKAEEIAGPRLGVLCFHPSVLPRHRGSDAVYWTLKMGDRESGVTWFWIDEGVDTGPIAAQAAIPIDPAATSPKELYFEQLVPLGLSLLAELLAKLERGERPSSVQDEALATYEAARPKKS